jgi:hypothetical protein
MERRWATEMSVMEMPCGRSIRMSPRASRQSADLSVEVMVPAAGPGESDEGWLQGGGDAHPVHSTAQNPIQDVMAQHRVCSEGGAAHARVGIRAVEGCSAAALHCGGI